LSALVQLTALLHDADFSLQLGQLRLHLDVQLLHSQQVLCRIVCRRINGAKVAVAPTTQGKKKKKKIVTTVTAG
jgi:hypothetical protein